ncbi:YhcH/YjgK/YiaL family protein [Paenibacillus thalictri]|uniref:YhcH/YjgK/YiaL family protein n=1 Tax=Paenibacillus thalictri TaxID=2527873 RepID=UPI0013EF0270|nr:YhcH/YjgK/YiaL family protein [Paenibacillus thalictri]
MVVVIFTDIESYRQEKSLYPKPVAQALDWLAQQDLAALKPGTYEVNGKELFAMVQEAVTAPKAERKPEHHFKYVDLQYLLEGEEVMYVGRPPRDGRAPLEENREKDIVFYDEAADELPIYLKPHQFVLLYPTDLHRPNCTESEIRTNRKVVFKIALSTLEL